jgi:Fe-S-cluster containining protein
MIDPSAINAIAKKREKENLKFRTFLKNRADEEELDGQFLALHNELFSGYDCCQCANCCKATRTTVQEDEIAPITEHLGVAKQEFVNTYLSMDNGGYELKSPCPFLTASGKCAIQECKPEECRDFPHTDKPERIDSLLGIVSFAEQCPVVFEMLERLKKIYRFRKR